MNSSAVALLGSAAVIVSMAGCGDDDSGEDTTTGDDENSGAVAQDASSCGVGEERAVFPALPKTMSVLLGCAEFSDGRTVELLSQTNSKGLCLQIVGLDDRGRECGNAPSEQEPPKDAVITEQFIAQANPQSPVEIFGATSTEVSRVAVEYTASDAPGRAPAELITVMDATALERAGITEPFGYFVAEVPADVRSITATATDSAGDAVGSASFDDLLEGQSRDVTITGVIRS